ncbi:DinB/UmuC family translesion DNA polymerase, partial [Geminicoccus harenae]
ADLRATSEAWLVRRFGRHGAWLARIAQGLDDRPVEPDRPRRSVSVEQTFPRDLVDPAALLAELRALTENLNRRLASTGFRGRSVVLKIRTADFVTRTRTTTPRPFPQDVENMWKIAAGLLERPKLPRDPVRLLGLGVSDGGDDADPRQLDLFGRSRPDSPQG